MHPTIFLIFGYQTEYIWHSLFSNLNIIVWDFSMCPWKKLKGSFCHWLWISLFKIQLQIFSITSKLWPISFVIHPTQSCLYQIISFNPFSKFRSNVRHNGWVISKAGAQQLLLGGLTAAWPSSQLWGGEMKWNKIICKGKRTSDVNDRGFCPAASIDHTDYW